MPERDKNFCLCNSNEVTYSGVISQSWEGVGCQPVPPLGVMVEEAATCDNAHSGSLSHRADPAPPPGPTALPATRCYLCNFPFKKYLLILALAHV